MGYLQAVWTYLLNSAPYLLFGFFISGLIHQYVPMSSVKKWLGGKSIFNIFKAALIGVPLPLCSCSVIPTAVTLKKSGASNGSTSAFLIATPESGVDSISMTYGLMDLPMTIIRPVAAFCSAFVAGTLQHFFNEPDLVEAKQPEVKACCKGKTETNLKKTNPFIESLKYGYGTLINDLAFWLSFGILAGALIDYAVPADFFHNLGPEQGRLAILAVGIPLYICASATTPVAVSLILKGISPGTALILLLVGPATNISNMAVLQQYIGKKGVILNVLSIIVVALFFSYLVDYFYAHYFVLNFKINDSAHNHESVNWFEKLSAILLIVLLVKGLFLENIIPFIKKKILTNSKDQGSKSCH